MTAPESTSYTSCLARLRDLQSSIRQFVSHVRLEEQILSRAQIQGTDGRKLNRWQLLEHELALARQAGTTDGGSRQSRWHSWMAVQKKVVQVSQPDACEEYQAKLHEVHHFRPGSDSTKPQARGN